MSRTIAILLLLLIAVPASSQALRQNRQQPVKQKVFFPVLKDGCWGYIDSTGKIVSEPLYRYAGNFSNHCAVAKQEGRYGAIDTAFAIILPFRFDSIINNGRHLIARENGLWYFYSSAGARLHKQGYRAVKEMSEKKTGPGYKVWSGTKCGLLDSTLSIILPIQYNRFIRYSPDLFITGAGSLYGLSSMKGKEIVPPSYHEITRYNDTMLLVRLNDKWGLVSHAGRVIPPQWSRIVVMDGQYLKGYNDTVVTLYSYSKGKAISSSYADYFPLTPEFVAVRSDKKIGVITATGKVSIEPRYEHVTALSPRFFCAGDKNKFGVITIKGDTVLPLQYSAVKQLTDHFNASMHSGFFKVYSGKKVGICDSTGRMIVPVNFTDIVKYDRDDIFRTEISGRYGLYNTKGTELFEAKYDVIGPLDGLIYVAHLGYCHAVASTDTVIAAPLYDKISQGTSSVKLYNGNQLEVVNLTSNGRVEDRFIYYDMPAFNVLNPPPPPSRRNMYQESESYDWVFSQVEGKWGVREKISGNMVVKTSFDAIYPTRYSHLWITELHIDTAIIYNVDGLRLMTNSLYGTVDLHGGKVASPCEYIYMGIDEKYSRERGFYITDVDPVIHRSGNMRFYSWSMHEKDAIVFIDRNYANGRRYCTEGTLKIAADAEGEPVDEVPSFYTRLLPGASLRAADKASFDMIMNDSLKLYADGTWNYIQALKEGAHISTHTVNELEYVENAGTNRIIARKYNGLAALMHVPVGTVEAFKYSSVMRFDKDRPFFVTGISDSLCGLMNSEGEIVAGTRWQDVRDFSEGFAAVMERNKWGYIDKNGSLLKELLYDEAGMFQDGLAKIRLDNYFGLIDKSGKAVLVPEYDEIHPFCNGLARVKKKGKYSFVRADGTVLSTPVLKKAEDFVKGYAVVRTSNGFGVIDTSGKIILEDKYEKAGAVGSGVAVPVKNKKGYALWSLEKKKPVTKFRYEKMEAESDGLILVRKENKFGFIDVNGKDAIAPQYDRADNFKNEMARVRLKKKWGYINHSGDLVIDLKYDELSFFNEDVAVAVENGKSYCIDRSGRMLFAIEGFELVTSFSNGYAIARKNDKVFYIDKSGRNFMDRYFDSAEPFENGYAKVYIEGYCRIINARGEFQNPPRYARVGHLHDGLRYVKLGVLYGMMDDNEKVIVPHRYEKVTPVTGEIIRVEKDDKIGYVNIHGKMIWELQR